MTHGEPIGIMQYWGGCPRTANSKWQRFLEVLRACSQRGWRTYLVWTRLPQERALYQPFEQLGCQILLQPRPARNFDLPCVIRTFRLLRAVRCQVFHCHNVHTSPLIGAALAGVPVRIWSDLAMSKAYEEGIVPGGLHRRTPSVRLSCALASRVWAISRAVRDELLQLGAPPAKVQVVPVPVDVQRYGRAIASGIRTELGLNPSDLLVTAVGHAVPVKGWDILVDAFGRACGTAEQVHLLLVGSTSSHEEIAFADQLRRQAAHLGIGRRVHLLGQRHDIPGILKASDVFAFPSRSDGQGLALTEALAAGLPCVAACVGGIGDLIAHGRNGLLFDREDAEGLAGHLKTLLANAALRTRLAVAARDKASRFSMQAYVDRSVDAYADLLGRSIEKYACMPPDGL